MEKTSAVIKVEAALSLLQQADIKPFTEGMMVRCDFGRNDSKIVRILEKWDTHMGFAYKIASFDGREGVAFSVGSHLVCRQVTLVQ